MGAVSPAAQILIPLPGEKFTSVPSSAAFSVNSATQPCNRFYSRLKMVDLFLRSAIVALLALSFSTMFTSTQSSSVQFLGLPIPISMKWTRVQPFRLLVYVDALMGGYSLFQIIYQFAVYKSPRKRQHMWIQLGADQACSYLVLSAAAAAAGAARVNNAGLAAWGFPSLCSVLDKFCHRVSIAIISTFVAAFVSSCCAALDMYILSVC